MRRTAKTVAGMSGRVGRRPASTHEGYLTAAETRAFNVSLKAFDAKRGNTQRGFKNFSFRNPPAAKPTIAPDMSQPTAAAKPAAPSIADIVAYLEQQRLAAELEAGKQALQFTRLFSQHRQDDAEQYRAKTLELLGVMDAVATTVRHLQQQPQPQ